MLKRVYVGLYSDQERPSLLSKLRSRLTYSNTISTLCLFLLLGGSAYAAATITGEAIKNSSITGEDVKDKSLTKKDFRGSVRGRRGATGPTALGQITVVQSAREAFGPEFVKSAIAFCPSGSRVVSGGGASVSDDRLVVTGATNDRSGWFVVGANVSAGGGEYVQAQALCAPAGKAIAASNKSRVRAQVAHLEAKVEAQRR